MALWKILVDCRLTRKYLCSIISCHKTFKNISSGNQKYEKGKMNYKSIIYVGIGVLFSMFSGCILLYIKRSKKESKNIESINNPYMSEKLVLYDGYPVLKGMEKDIQIIKNFKVRDDDVFVISYPKSGTTWVQEIVYLISTDCDYKKAQSIKLDDRFPFLEFPCPGLKHISQMESPRFIKSHLPYKSLPVEIHKKLPKVIYISRDPKDVVVSYYHFSKQILAVGYHGDFQSFFRQFMDGKVLYGLYWEHVKSFYDHRDDGNILFITYEDLQKDLPGMVNMIAKFLGKQLSTEDIQNISNHCSFESMKKNPAVNYDWLVDMGVSKPGEPFMRKGIVGGWRNYLSEEMIKEIDEKSSQV